MKPLHIGILIAVLLVDAALVLIALIEGGVIPNVSFVDQGRKADQEEVVVDR